MAGTGVLTQRGRDLGERPLQGQGGEAQPTMLDMNGGVQRLACAPLREGPPPLGGGEGGLEVLGRQARRKAEMAFRAVILVKPQRVTKEP